MLNSLFCNQTRWQLLFAMSDQMKMNANLRCWIKKNTKMKKKRKEGKLSCRASTYLLDTNEASNDWLVGKTFFLSLFNASLLQMILILEFLKRKLIATRYCVYLNWFLKTHIIKKSNIAILVYLMGTNNILKVFLRFLYIKGNIFNFQDHE